MIISSQHFGFRKSYSTEMAIIDLQSTLLNKFLVKNILLVASFQTYQKLAAQITLTYPCISTSLSIIANKTDQTHKSLLKKIFCGTKF